MKRYLFLLALLTFLKTYSQCPQVYDGTGVTSSNPYWINCTGTAYTLNFSSPSSIGSYTVIWGDGTANTTGSSLSANTIITHSYAAVVDTFIVKLITSSPSCTLTGVMVMEKPVNASIQIPVGGVTTACAPATLAFINSSTDVSQTTTFTWNFGDGTANQTYNYTNDGQTVTHTYNKGTVNCQTIVTLSAQNYCTFGTPTTAEFNPIQIYDIDQAAITPSAYIKCWPDNSFTYTNTTARNCYAQGNNGIRYEKWNFGNYWGTGHDSIINWTAWPPTFPKTVAYPSVGNYTTVLIDSNECGVDTTSITVSIVNRPTAGLTVSPSTVCLGTSMTFTNTSSTGYSYKWNFGDNGIYTSTGYSPQTHTYGSAGTYTVSVVAYIAGAPNSCKDTARVAVTVLAAPTADFTDVPSVGCNSITTTFTDASTGGVTTWHWNFGNTQTFNGQNPPTQTYTTGVYAASLTVTSADGCINTKTKTITVYQKPVPQFTTSVACLNNLVSFTDQSTHAAGDNITSWTWNFGDGSSLNHIQNPSYTYTATNTYSITLSVATAHCSDSITIPLTINPLPLVSFTNVVDSGCPALVVTFTNTSSGTSSYLWNFGNGQTSTNTNPTETFSNTTTTTQNYTVTLIGTTAAGCKDSVKHSVKIFGKPIASFTSNATANCAPLAVTFTNTSLSAVSYVWNFGDNTATTTSVSPSHLYQNNTGFLQNYTVTLYATNAGGCIDSTKQIVQAYPQAQFNFQSLPDSGCAPLLVSFPAQSGAVLYQWDFGDGSATTTGASPTHTFTNTTSAIKTFTTQLIATNAFTCKDTAYQTIKVFPKPTSSFTTSITSGCAPLAVTFTNTSTNANTYQWVFGDGNSVSTTNAAHTYTTSSLALDSFQVKLLVYNSYSCSDTSKKEIYVFPKVNAFFTSDTIGCSPLHISYINGTQGATNYVWNFGDATPTVTVTNPSHTYTNTSAIPQTYTTQLIGSNSFGCSDTAKQKITVLPKPSSSFTTNVTSGCAPLAVTFTNTSTNVNTYQWVFGDGSSTATTNTSHTYTTSSLALDSFQVKLLVYNSYSCSDTSKKEIYVFPKVSASFTSDTIGCSPLHISYINGTQGATNYIWNFGDATPTVTVTNPSHTYTNTSATAQTYTTQVVAGNSFGCSDTAKQKITVWPKPTSSFSLSPAQGCTPLNPVFFNTSVNASIFNWTFGDGNSSSLPTPAHTFVNSSLTQQDSFNVQLIVTNTFNCKDTSVKKVYVYPQVIASFYADTPICAPVTITFHNTTQSTALTTYTWNFGDGSPLDNSTAPSHVYNNTTGNVLFDFASMTATNSFGCSNTYTHTYMIFPKPIPQFVMTPTVQTYPSRTILLTNHTPNDSSFTNVWHYGDGNSFTGVNSPNHTYSTWGTYSVTLVTSSTYCKDSVTQLEIIKPPLPIAGFKGKKKGCLPLKVAFVSTSQYATSYDWDFGDNLGSSSIPNPTYVYTQAGSYNVKLVVTGPGGQDSIVGIDSVVVYPLPHAIFTAAPTLVSVGVDPVVCSNLSSGATTYDWDFGDGTALVTDVNPQHTYQQAGQFAITLYAISIHGCRDSLTYALITAQQETSVQVPNAFTPNTSGPSANGVYDPTSHDNDIFHPNVSGLKTYELDIFNRWGELLFISNDIHVGWDGYYKGKACEQGIYVWKIVGESISGQHIEKKGDLTLLR